MVVVVVMTEGWRTGCGRGEFGGREAKGANRLGFGHCPENSASDSPLIKPPPPTNPLNNRERMEPAVCGVQTKEARGQG